MKAATKVSLGLGLVAIAGVATAAIASEKLLTKGRYMTNRCKVKKFVLDKFGGNETLLNVVDKLDDEELDYVMQLSKKVKSGKKEAAAHAEDAKEKLQDFFNQIF